jgi:ATP-dependent RNA helicase SUPV3L1/SUV3
LRRGPARHLSPAGKGLIYQLEQSLGTVLSETAREQLSCLTARDRELMRQMNVYIGYRVVFVRGLLRPEAVRARQALCAAYYDYRAAPLALKESAVSVRVSPAISPAVYLAIGYPAVGPRAIRADIVERFSQRLYRLARNGPFGVHSDFGNWLGCPPKEVAAVVEALGYRRDDQGLYAAAHVAVQPEDSDDVKEVIDCSL